MLIWVSYLSFSWTYAFSAVKAALRFAFASLCFERAWNLMKLGMAIAARMPMIATTIISSIRVKPFIIFFTRVLLGVGSGNGGFLPPNLRGMLQGKGRRAQLLLRGRAGAACPAR